MIRTFRIGETCVLCRLPAVGYARNAEGGRLCHHEARDCYKQWTVHGVRILLAPGDAAGGHGARGEPGTGPHEPTETAAGRPEER